ncbi:MAG: hypothetical protein H6Q15_1400 [Bacteroidetes bacterium]|nr:hypothetical protein [Bacteroidota bacterium]
MEYNTERMELRIPEYGRNVQKMVEYAFTIEDRAKRTAYANLIINSMSNVNPEAKNIVDYKHKLWDHLFIISDYKLDVDSPYPIPDIKERLSPPQLLTYKNSKIEFGPYGNVLENMIKKLIEMEESEEKSVLIELIAQQLKKSYLQWNRDSVDDELILKHFEQLSKGQLKLQEDFKLNTTRNILNNNRKKTPSKGPSRTNTPANNSNPNQRRTNNKFNSPAPKFNRNQK